MCKLRNILGKFISIDIYKIFFNDAYEKARKGVLRQYTSVVKNLLASFHPPRPF